MRGDRYMAIYLRRMIEEDGPMTVDEICDRIYAYGFVGVHRKSVLRRLAEMCLDDRPEIRLKRVMSGVYTVRKEDKNL